MATVDPHPGKRPAFRLAGLRPTSRRITRSGDHANMETATSGQPDAIALALRVDGYAEDADARGNHRRAAELRRLADALRAKARDQVKGLPALLESGRGEQRGTDRPDARASDSTIR